MVVASAKRLVLYVGTIPSDLGAWLLLCMLRVVAGKDLRWLSGALVCELRRDSWFVRYVMGGYGKLLKFRDGYEWGGTTIAPHAIVLNENTSDTLEHELVHSEQMEASGLVGLATTIVLITVVGFHAGALIPWIVFPWVIAGSSYLTAFLRGESVYYGAAIEEAAYAETKNGNTKTST